MRNGYRKMTKANIKAISAGMKQYAELEKLFNLPQIQSNRFFRDCIIGSLCGVSEMNTDMHGWDGGFPNGFYFENKNISAHSKSSCSYALKFQDTSEEKLAELCQGVIAATTAWFNSGEPAFLMVGNTKNVRDELVASYRPQTRRSNTVSMTRCLNKGFKLVALGYTKEQVISVISDKFPRLGRSLTPADIYTEEELPALVAEMMK